MRNREEVVKLMSDYIDDMNTNMARAHGLSEDEINKTLAEHRPELDNVNGLLYDLLVDQGLIMGR